MRRKKIALDVDGVMLSFMKSFDKAAEMFLGKEVTIYHADEMQAHYELEKRLNISTDLGQKILQFMIDSRMYESLPALEGARQAVQEIKRADFEIIVITAVPEAAQQMRLVNLKNEVDLVPDEIYCVGMGCTKKEVLELVRPDVYIDDRIDYLSTAGFVPHLVWCDQREVQSDLESQVDIHVHSLLEWTQQHMPKVVRMLDDFYLHGVPLQTTLKLESPKRRYYK